MDHPAIDILTDAAGVVLQDRAVVPLSPWLSDAVRFCATSKRALQVLTPRSSRLTVVLEPMLGAADSRWVVRDGDAYLDGLRGQPLQWNGSQFVAQVGFESTGEWGAPEPVNGGTIRVDLSVLHKASAAVQLGRIVEDSFEALTRAGPTGWGVAEPATQRWNREQLTDFCRRRSPRPLSLVVVGGSAAAPAVGTVLVQRRPSGIVERLRLAVGGPADAAPDTESVDRLAAHLMDLHPVRTLLASLHPGRGDCTVAVGDAARRVPYGLLIGAEGVGERGVEHARAAPAPSVTVTGPAGRPGCWIRLAGGEGDSATVLAGVLRHFDMSGRRAQG